MWNSRYFFGGEAKRKEVQIVEQVQPEMREFCCKSSSCVRDANDGKKKAHEVKFSIPLTFCTHSMLHNFFLCLLFFSLYLFHAWCSRAREKRLDMRTAKHKFLFSCCKECTCFGSASRLNARRRWCFLPAFDPGPRSSLLSFRSVLLSLLFPSLIVVVMQVMNFKLKGGLKLLTHVCMQIFPFSRTHCSSSTAATTNTAVHLLLFSLEFESNDKRRNVMQTDYKLIQRYNLYVYYF